MIPDPGSNFVQSAHPQCHQNFASISNLKLLFLVAGINLLIEVKMPPARAPKIREVP